MGIYSDKLWAACQLIKEYNAHLFSTSVPTSPKVKALDPEKFVEKLVVYGGVADEMLQHCRWEDLENCGLPRLLARKVAGVFRAADVPKELMAQSQVARQWLPLLKKWKVSWRDYVNLVDRLEEAKKSWPNAENLTEDQLTEILQLIKNESK